VQHRGYIKAARRSAQLSKNIGFITVHAQAFHHVVEHRLMEEIAEDVRRATARALALALALACKQAMEQYHYL